MPFYKKGKLRIAICTKVIGHIYAMLKNEEYHRYRDEKNHSSKIKAYNNFLKKNGIEIEEKKFA